MDWFSSPQPPGSDHSPLSGRRINLRGEHVDRHRADTLVALPVEGVLAVHQSGLGQRLQFSGLFQ